MKSRRRPRHGTTGKQRKPRRFIFKRLITPFAKIAQAVWNQLFEFWKTLPDSMKTAVVLSFLSVSAGLLVPLLKSIRNCNQPQEHPPKLVETIRNDSQSDHPNQSSRKLKGFLAVRQVQRLNSSLQTVGSLPDENNSQALASTRQTVGLGNYGEAFRQLKVVLETLPRTEQTRLAEDFSEANKMYDRGEFREAAYKMLEKLQARPIKSFE